MNKPVLGLLLGGVLGIFDGLSALVSAPETAPDIVGIVIGSTIKGIVAGAIIGWIATRVRSAQAVILAGLAVGAFFAFLIAAIALPQKPGAIAADQGGRDRQDEEQEQAAPQAAIAPARPIGGRRGGGGCQGHGVMTAQALDGCQERRHADRL